MLKVAKNGKQSRNDLCCKNKKVHTTTEKLNETIRDQLLYKKKYM